MHEVDVAKRLIFLQGFIVVINRGYVDYALFAKWTDVGHPRMLMIRFGQH